MHLDIEVSPAGEVPVDHTAEAGIATVPALDGEVCGQREAQEDRKYDDDGEPRHLTLGVLALQEALRALDSGRKTLLS